MPVLYMDRRCVWEPDCRFAQQCTATRPDIRALSQLEVQSLLRDVISVLPPTSGPPVINLFALIDLRRRIETLVRPACASA